MTSRFNTLGLAAVLGLGAATAMSAFAPASAENFTLRIGSGHNPGPVGYVKMMRDFFVPQVTERVAARTDHTIEFVEGYSGTIVGVFETLEGVQDGVVDIGGFCVCFEEDKTAAMNVTYFLPFTTPDPRVSVQVLNNLIDEFPQIVEDLESQFNQSLIAISGFDNYGLGTNFEWDNTSDLVGKKILAAGPNLPWLPEGTIGVNTTLPTAFEQLDTGVGEGIIIFPGTYFGFKFYEPAANYKVTNFGAMSQIALTMNLDTRAALPAEVVAIIDEVAKEYEQVTAQWNVDSEASGLEALRGVIPVTEMTRAAQIDWANALEAWPAERAAFLNDTVPGAVDYADVMCRYIELFNDAGHEFPANYGGPLGC